MNKTYITGDIHNRIEKFDEYFQAADHTDTVYQLGDIIFGAGSLTENEPGQQTHERDMATLLYFYNLAHNPNSFKLHLIKGNHEYDYFLHPKYFKDLDVKFLHQYLLQMNLKLYDASLNLPSGEEMYEFFSHVPMKIELEDLILVHGWINPAYYGDDLTNEIIDEKIGRKNINNIKRHIVPINKVMPVTAYKYIGRNGYTWGTPAKIYEETYKRFCEDKGLEYQTKTSFNEFIKEENSGYWYYGLKSLQDYNEWVKNNVHKRLVMGHRPDPLKTNWVKRPYWTSHLIFLDTGIGYGDIFGDGKDNEQMFITDITNQKQIQFSMFPLPFTEDKIKQTNDYLASYMPDISWETILKDYCK